MAIKGEKLYEGKSKIIFATEDKNLLIQYFKDEATAFNGEKKGIIQDKGIYNNLISCILFQGLSDRGIRTHFVEKIDERQMLVKKVNIIPIEIVVRNVVAGSLAKRMGMEEGVFLNRPVLEYYLKDDSLGDPMINDFHIRAFSMASEGEITWINSQAFYVNQYLMRTFSDIGLILVDFKLEFGRGKRSEIMLADEISPDSCRLWDKETKERMDKDRFRRDLGKLEETYKEVYERMKELKNG